MLTHTKYNNLLLSLLLLIIFIAEIKYETINVNLNTKLMLNQK